MRSVNNETKTKLCPNKTNIIITPKTVDGSSFEMPERANWRYNQD